MSNKDLPNYRTTSLSDRIRDDLEHRIRTSVLKSGEKLPPEPTLATILGVSRNSLREAVKTLQDKGLLIKRRGVGTFITAQQPLLNIGIEHLMGVTQFIREQGFKSLSKIKKYQWDVADGEAAIRLCLDSTNSLMILETVKYADSDPVAVCVDYVPIKFLDKPPRPEDLYDSIFEGLERHHGINIRLAECEILSVAAEPAQAEDLSVGIGTPLLLLRQVHIDIKERRILYSKSYFPSNKLTFRLIRHRQNITY